MMSSESRPTHTIKVFLEPGKGETICKELPVSELSEHGIIKLENRYFVFSRLHKSSGVVFVESSVYDLNN